ADPGHLGQPHDRLRHLHRRLRDNRVLDGRSDLGHHPGQALQRRPGGPQPGAERSRKHTPLRLHAGYLDRDPGDATFTQEGGRRRLCGGRFRKVGSVGAVCVANRGFRLQDFVVAWAGATEGSVLSSSSVAVSVRSTRRASHGRYTDTGAPRSKEAPTPSLASMHWIRSPTSRVTTIWEM